MELEEQLSERIQLKRLKDEEYVSLLHSLQTMSYHPNVIRHGTLYVFSGDHTNRKTAEGSFKQTGPPRRFSIGGRNYSKRTFSFEPRQKIPDFHLWTIGEVDPSQPEREIAPTLYHYTSSSPNSQVSVLMSKASTEMDTWISEIMPLDQIENKQDLSVNKLFLRDPQLVSEVGVLVPEAVIQYQVDLTILLKELLKLKTNIEKKNE